MILLPREYCWIVVSGGAPGIQWLETKDAAKDPTMNRTAYNQELSGPKHP